MIGPLEKEIPLGNHHFQARTVSFREGGSVPLQSPLPWFVSHSPRIFKVPLLVRVEPPMLNGFPGQNGKIEVVSVVLAEPGELMVYGFLAVATKTG